MQMGCVFFYFCDMKTNRFRYTKLSVLIILFVYCITIPSSIIFHNHDPNDKHNHENCTQNELKYFCVNEIDCTHNQHVKKRKEICLLCYYSATYEYTTKDRLINNITQNIVDLDFVLSESLFNKKSDNLSNKSPPSYI